MAELMSHCTGRGGSDGSHCCYVNGQVCSFLERGTIEGRNFVCGLRRELGSWRAVNADPRYRPIGQAWVSINQRFNYCETWQPELGQCCREER